MTELKTPFVCMNADRKLTKDELIRAIRFSIADEFEAIQLYTQLSESINDKFAKGVLLDIANEEKEHVGELMYILKYLAPDEEGYYKEGEEEAEELFKKLS